MAAWLLAWDQGLANATGIALYDAGNLGEAIDAIAERTSLLVKKYIQHMPHIPLIEFIPSEKGSRAQFVQVTGNTASSRIPLSDTDF